MGPSISSRGVRRAGDRGHLLRVVSRVGGSIALGLDIRGSALTGKFGPVDDHRRESLGATHSGRAHASGVVGIREPITSKG